MGKDGSELNQSSEDLENITSEGEAPQTEEMVKKHGSSFGKGILCGILITSVVMAGTAFAFYAVQNSRTLKSVWMEEQAGENKELVTEETMQKMKTIEEVIDTYYYGEEVTMEALQDGVYKGIVEALNDPYSEYYSKEELEDVLNSNQGVSYGIGAYISLDQKMNMPMIAGVMEDTPAKEAGLLEGDIIYQVDGEYTQGLSVTKVVSMVKGREGTTVHLTIYREGEADYLELDIVRAKQIESTTVDYGMVENEDGIGYLRIREFDTVTVDQYTEAMAYLKENGMKAMILDLRSNPGGDLTAVVDIARKILPEGMIVYTEDKNGERKEYTGDGSNELQIPLTVLVNGYSASASEILAGAIQDYDKGTLIGTTTYGKGIVQRIHRLNDGTAIKLTVSAYFTPSGRNIHGIGITPDIELEYDQEAYDADGTDNQVEKAIEVLKKIR